MNKCPIIATFASALFAAATASAGEPCFAPVSVDSGWAQNTGETSGVIFAELIEVEEASWVRVDFEIASLGEAPRGGKPTIVRVTSVREASSQRLTGEHVEQWQHMSAYFNGNAVLVEVIGDWTRPGEIDINNFFAFLGDFAAGELHADLNNDGNVDVNDFFLFLSYFDRGC